MCSQTLLNEYVYEGARACLRAYVRACVVRASVSVCDFFQLITHCMSGLSQLRMKF